MMNLVRGGRPATMTTKQNLLDQWEEGRNFFTYQRSGLNACNRADFAKGTQRSSGSDKLDDEFRLYYLEIFIKPIQVVYFKCSFKKTLIPKKTKEMVTKGED